MSPRPFGFDGGEPEDFIDLINRHKDLLKDLELKEKFEAMKKVKFEKERELDSIREKRSSEAIQLKEELTEIESSMKGYHHCAKSGRMPSTSSATSRTPTSAVSSRASSAAKLLQRYGPATSI